MPERQCPAGLLIFDAVYDAIEHEYRCELPKWHEGRHKDAGTEWTADD